MRWAVLFLVFLNALVMGVRWVEQQRQASHLSMRVRSGDLPTLTLLQEVAHPDAPRSRGWRSRLPLCILLGPIEREGAARAMIDSLASRDVGASLFASSLQLAPEYWVYLSPFVSREVALEKLREMQAKQVDSYLITQGELRNGISLGFFKNADTATGLQARRRKQGYDALLKEVPRIRSEYWVLIDKPLTRERQTLQETLDFGALGAPQQREILCKGVVAS